MALAESSLSFRYAEMNFRSQVQSIPSALYAVGLMLLFLSHDVFTPRQSKWLADIGKHSYGIYLLHPVILEVCARSLQEFLPDVLAYQWLYLPLLMVPGVGIPLVLMRIIPRTTLRRHYKHLFG
jgi:peptidoglycan/LPS O-acetylase OafA/YrhL